MQMQDSWLQTSGVFPTNCRFIPHSHPGHLPVTGTLDEKTQPSLVKKHVRILYVEDVPADVVMVNHALRQGGMAFRSKRVETKEDFLRELEQDPPDVILSDHGLPSFDGFTALAIARDKCPDVP